jgi:hypothetical protein
MEIISLYSIMTEKESVYCAVGSETFNRNAA